MTRQSPDFRAPGGPIASTPKFGSIASRSAVAARVVTHPVAAIRTWGEESTVRAQCASSEYPAPLLAVAAHQLPGALPAFPAAPLDATAWSSVLKGARTHRVTGLLRAAVSDGVFPATAEQIREAQAVHRAITMRVMALEGELTSIVSILSAADIDCRVLKGSAFAYLDYADPTLRSFIDIDVLVRSVDIDRAAETLKGAGFIRTLAEPRTGFDRRFDKGMTLIPSNGYELDLHRTFVLGPWGVLMDLDQLWDDGEEFTVAGQQLRALSRPYRLVHACFHAALGNWPLRLGSLRDVAELLRRSDDADAAQVCAIAGSWGADAVVAAAVADSRRLLGVAAEGQLSRWAASYVPSARERRWLALHTNPDKTFAAQALATLRVLPCWRDKVDYVSALAMPDRSYTADRHGSVLGRFGYAIREMRLGSGSRRLRD